MTALTITRGYPGSGKSHKAHAWVAEDPENRARVNRDDLRKNLFGIYWGLTFAQENTITAVQRASVRALIRAGKDVIVDDTNLRLRNARAWADLAVELGAEFHVWDMLITADECIGQDDDRDRTVGADVIRKMAARFPMPWPEVKPSERSADTPPAAYVPDTTKPKAWLVDIDGTLAHMGDRSPYDITTVGNDTPDDTIVDLVKTIHQSGPELVIMSGRSDECRVDTIRWLIGNGIDYSALHMRPAADKRADYKVKADLFDEYVRDRWNVIGVLDDRDQVVKMWRSIGLKCLQVADGAF